MTSGCRHASAAMLWVMAVSLSAGCDRLPWASKTDAKSGAGARSQSAASALLQNGAVVPESERVATVGQSSISTTDIELATLELKRFVQANRQEWRPLPAQELPEALDLTDVMQNIIVSELKAQDARARGLDRRTDVQRRLAYLQREFYAQEWDRWQRERAVASEEGAHQFYEQNKAGFVEPERIRVRQIVAETLAEAEAVRAQAIQGAVFAQLAREKSIGAGKEQGGEIGWHLRAIDKERLRLIGASPSEEMFFPQLEPVAFALELNQVSQPVKGPDGRYYLVQLEERRPARQQTELEVHDAIKELLTLQTLQRQIQQLREQAKVESFPERLSGVPQ